MPNSKTQFQIRLSLCYLNSNEGKIHSPPFAWHHPGKVKENNVCDYSNGKENKDCRKGKREREKTQLVLTKVVKTASSGEKQIEGKQ